MIPTGWEEKRNKTFVVFCLLNFVVGIEWGLLIPTLYHYISKDIKTENADIWFGFTNAGYWVMSIIGGLTITRYSDSTRNVRRCVVFICLVAMVGNLIYLIPYHPIFPLIGRSLQGLADSLISVLNGEVLRIFPAEKVMKKISLFIGVAYASMLVSPGLVIAFKRVKTSIFSLPLTPSNSPTLLIGSLWLTCFILTIVFVDDLSKSYDLKSEEAKKQTKEEDKELYKFSSSVIPLKNLFRNEIFCFIIILSPLAAYTETINMVMILLVVAENRFHLSTNYTAIILSISGLFFGFTVYCIAKFNKHKLEVMFVIMGLCSFVMSCQFLTISMITSGNIGIFCLCLFAFTQSIGWSVSQVLLATVLAQVVPSSTQSVGEGIRRSMESLSRMVAGVIGGFIQPYVIEHSFTLSIALCLSVAYLLYRHKIYCNLQLMILK